MYTNLKTEYSFKQVFGPVGRVVDRLSALGAGSAVIADTHNTFGHMEWIRTCEAAKIKPILGSTFSLVKTIEEGEKAVSPAMISVIALKNSGIEELYELVQKSFAQFYYHPRITYEDLNRISNHCAVIAGYGVDWKRVTRRDCYGLIASGYSDNYPERIERIAGQSNLWINQGDQRVYGLLTGEQPYGNRHIIPAAEWLSEFEDFKALQNADELMDLAEHAKIEKAPMVSYPNKPKGGMLSVCQDGAKALGIDLSDPEYKARLEREITLIEDKQFEDYFFVVADLVDFAKRHMLVGPSRGSSAGSLVCYLMGITTVNPIPFGLLFERFIDINRADLPDIDIDFPDRKRHLVIEYLRDKYGHDNVSHIGTVSRLMPKSAIGLFAKGLQIPAYETDDLKGAIIERSSGDARAAMCITDTFDTTDIGKEFIKKHPQMMLVGEVEGHARHAGMHAAGIIVCNNPITRYAGIDSRNDVAMLDKHEAETANLLKIDVLGLRTLSILEECCDDIGMPYEDLPKLPLDDQAAFDLLTNMKVSGVFQFEGYALQSLLRGMGVSKFDDIVAITALARPGPLHSGGATEFVKRRTGQEPVVYYSQHPAVIKHTEAELGTFIYQEQIMNIAREFGGLSWEDVSALRKAISKSLGEEFFGKYKAAFMKGVADSSDVPESEAEEVWNSMVMFGSYGFNKSHAVGYGLLSYYCAYLKAHHPLEFAKANLNNARDDAQSLKLLREFDLPYTAIDPDHSAERWVITDGRLIGPLTNIKGIGDKIASDIVQRRSEGRELTKSQAKKLINPKTAFDELYPCWAKFGHFYENPRLVLSRDAPIHFLKDVKENGHYLFIGRLIDRNQRDLNEYGSVAKRGGKQISGNTLFLNLTLEDDTDSIICTIGRFDFEKYGREIAEKGKVGEDWYIVYGSIRNDWRKIQIKHIKRLTTDADQETRKDNDTNPAGGSDEGHQDAEKFA